ncbi:BON domain-containing protein [Burkholderia ubonensis]|uniref:BON domain-containing protein n=1 Tax=Burkholderia ubonensis TaxID=101571 RepID=UPI001E3B2D3A|nr:BON domain-containing protein [Burkholderia ubonensis]
MPVDKPACVPAIPTGARSRYSGYPNDDDIDAPRDAGAVSRLTAPAARSRRNRTGASRAGMSTHARAGRRRAARRHVQREENMRPIKLAVLALIPLFTVATTAVAQTAAPASASAVSTPGKKQLRRANWYTETQVRKALTSTRGLATSDIRIVARADTITLDGTVPDQAQIELAQTAAQAAAPANSVVNRLSVKEAGH